MTPEKIILSISFIVFSFLPHHDAAMHQPQPSQDLGSEEPWKYVSTHVGIDTFMKKIPGTKLIAFRGVGVIDSHISEALGLFCDFDLAYEWVEMLYYMQAYPPLHDIETDIGINDKSNTIIADSSDVFTEEDYRFCKPHDHTDIVYQLLKLPWPVSPREIVLQRHWEYIQPSSASHTYNLNNTVSSTDTTSTVAGMDTSCRTNSSSSTCGSNSDIEGGDRSRPGTMARGGSVTCRYHSVEDPRIPHKPGVIRAVSPHTLWRFEDVTHTHTHENTHTTADKPGDDGKSSAGSPQKRYTRVEVECIVDSKGSIPAWLINFMQKQWPTKALTAFNKLIKRRNNQHSTGSSDGTGSGSGSSHADSSSTASGFWSSLSKVSSGSAAFSGLSGSSSAADGLTTEEQKRGHDGRERAKTKIVEPFKPVLHW